MYFITGPLLRPIPHAHHSGGHHPMLFSCTLEHLQIREKVLIENVKEQDA